jgi:hypothetical protein
MAGRLLLIAVLLCTAVAFAADPPDAPSATKAALLHSPAEFNASPVSFDVREFTTAMVERPIENKKVVDKKFMVLAGIATGLTIADFEMTQSCMARHLCVETDPLMPTSRAGMYASSAPVNAGLTYLSYRLKARGKRYWWVPMAAIVASHAIGVGTNVRFLK